MPLTAEIPGRLYSQSLTIQLDGQYNLRAEIDAVRDIPASTGFCNFVCSAGLAVQSLGSRNWEWSEELQYPVAQLGYIEVCVGDFQTWRSPINAQRLALPKFTGATDGATIARPGDPFIVGNGGTNVLVNVASDRPVRGDTIKYNLVDGVEALLLIGVVTDFVDNLANTNKYFILI